MTDLNEIVNSAAVLIKQADAATDDTVKNELRGAARTLLKQADIQLAPGSIPAPAPDPVPEEEDD